MELLGRPRQHVETGMERLLVSARFRQRDVGLGPWPEAFLGLQAGRQGGLVDVAEGREIIVGNPLPQLQLLRQEHRRGVEHVENGPRLEVGLPLVQLHRNGGVGLALAQRHEQTHAGHHSRSLFGGHRIGEQTVERQGKDYVYIAHRAAKIRKKNDTVGPWFSKGPLSVSKSYPSSLQKGCFCRLKG